jgi:hypothetical protein
VLHDADGYLSWWADLGAGPVLELPMMRFDLRQRGDGCRVMFDGRVQSSGEFAIAYPPRGSYVVEG